MRYATRHKLLRSLGFHIPALILSVIMIYPLVWMFASSLKPNEEVFTTVTSLVPSRFVWENYVTGWQSTGRYTYATYFTNSFTIALWSTLGGVVSSSLVAYAFARIPFVGKKFWFHVVPP